MNEPEKLINWVELSRQLSHNKESIRKGYSPKKYRRQVYRLIRLIKLWQKWAGITVIEKME